MTEDRRDALIARDRVLAAIAGTDLETGRALWKAALRYHRRARVADASGLERNQGARLPRVGEARHGCAEWDVEF